MRFLKRIKVFRSKFIAFFIVLIILIIIVESKIKYHQRHKRFEKWIPTLSQRDPPELGNFGEPAFLSDDEKNSASEIYSKKAMNVALSNKISLRRKLKDVRDPLCKKKTYDAVLPTASIVIIFYNEPLSVLLRTVHSILRETPVKLLKEILLVDDGSDEEDLKDPLENHIKVQLPHNVRLLRLPKRQGLIKARLTGSENATGDVLLFLDAHCEVIKEWLPPLLQRIKEKRNTVVMPIIDVISEETFEYHKAGLALGGFQWTGDFVWIEMSEDRVRSRDSPVSPIATPTMAGGLFAVDRAYFWEIGSYDDKMEGWGGENLEMSFRVWQCGGSLEIVPCSRVGHVFRNFFPYEFPNKKDTFAINTARVAQVWMDEYKEFFFINHYYKEYETNPSLIGDIEDRLALRKRLNCKSFKWYLQNIYPEKFIPNENTQYLGRVNVRDSNLCLDNLNQDEDQPYSLSVNTCKQDLHSNQYFSLTNYGLLRKEEKCATVLKDSLKIQMESCTVSVKNKQWKFKDGKLVHKSSGLCLDATGLSPLEIVVAASCDDSPGQIWDFEFKN